jgi:hypothetical protein
VGILCQKSGLNLPIGKVRVAGRRSTEPSCDARWGEQSTLPNLLIIVADGSASSNHFDLSSEAKYDSNQDPLLQVIVLITGQRFQARASVQAALWVPRTLRTSCNC